MPKFQMTPEKLNPLLHAKQALLIDVRDTWEYQHEYIPGAILIPLSTLSLDKLPDATDKTIVIQCRSGQRSDYACDLLLTQQPDLNVYNLTGGIMSWKNMGYQTINS